MPCPRTAAMIYAAAFPVKPKIAARHILCHTAISFLEIPLYFYLISVAKSRFISGDKATGPFSVMR